MYFFRLANSYLYTLFTFPGPECEFFSVNFKKKITQETPMALEEYTRNKQIRITHKSVCSITQDSHPIALAYSLLDVHVCMCEHVNEIMLYILM